VSPSPDTQRAIVKRLKQITTLQHVPEKDALQQLSELIDAAEDLSDRPALEHALTLAKTIRPRAPEAAALLDYFAANRWHAIRRLNYKAGKDPHSWTQPEFIEEVVCLRRAVSGSGFKVLPAARRLEILTNLGNLMSHLGRVVEAIEYFDRAIAEPDASGMAVGNRGYALCCYSDRHADLGHRRVLRAAARDDLANAVGRPLTAQAKAGFTRLLANLDQRGLRKGLSGIRFKSFNFGRSKLEGRFRRWALRERLFLNSLNDLGSHRIAARDVLQLPTIVTSLKVGPSYHGFFNQLKQEFAAARWLAFEALEPGREAAVAERVADRELGLLDARDGAAYGLRLEKLRLSFRSAYSLLDKVAVFLNAYFKLGLPEKRINVRSVWYDNADLKSKLNIRLPQVNLPLRGLYWLSKDFAETEASFVAAMESDAQQLVKMRNRLEHQYLRITPFERQIWKDEVAYDISEDLLGRRTLRLLRSVRAAMIYFVLAIHAHERTNARKPPPGPMISDQLDPI
jgi:hypothetical protein